MGRALPLAAAVLIAIAAGVWLMWPADPQVQPAPGSPAAAEDPANAPALATAGGRSAAGNAIPAGGAAPERAAGAGVPGNGSDEASGRGAPGKDASGAAAKSRPAGDGGAAGDPAAGDAPAGKKKELWQGNLALRGRILDPAGKPIAGARVLLRDAWPWPGAPPRPFVQTDAEGRFAYGDLPSNTYQVFVDTGAGEQPVAWNLLPGQEPYDLTLKPAQPKVTPPGATVVRVVGPDGKPVPRASVRVRPVGGFVDLVDGTFLRAPLDDGKTSYEVFRAEALDYTPLPLGPTTWTPKAGLEDVVVLPQGMSIDGRVVGPDAEGVFGAEVQAYPVPDPARAHINSGSPMAVGRATSDRTGAFHLVNLGEGPYRLQATPIPPHLASEPLDTPVAVDSVTIRVPKGLEAEVTVLDGEGKAVAGAVVSAQNTGSSLNTRQGRGTSRQVTDATGRTRLSQLVPGVAYELQASPPSSRKDVSPFSQKAWEPKDTTVTLPRAWSLKGTVRRADGAAKLSFVHRRGANGAWVIATTTKKDGSFELKFAEPGPWVLAASASFDTPRGAELTITDPALAVELNAPAAAAPPTK